MQIREIKKDKQHLTKLIFEDESVLLLDNDICAEEGIAVGADIDGESLKEYKAESDYRRAKSRAMWYLDRMDYTEKALYEKLIKAGFGAKASAKVLAKLCELGLVDDRRYAERFAERCRDSNVSKREAVHKMLFKGVPLELARQVTEELETDEVGQVLALIEKKYERKLSEEGGYQKVFAALARKGFAFESIKSALKKYNEELEFSED